MSSLDFTSFMPDTNNMNYLDILLLSIIEGITEFLPISSTGHLVLFSNILGVSNSKILGTFEIAIQIGPILGVIFLYYRRFLAQKNLIYKSIIGFLPTGILGILLYPFIKSLLSSEIVTVLSLLIGGLLIILIERFFKTKKYNPTKDVSKMTYKDSILIGLLQSISMIPGVSRSASSIFGGMILGLDRKSAVEFSFFLAVPTMMAATSYDLLKNASSFSGDDFMTILIGILLSFLVAIIVMKWLLRYIQTNDFFWFGIYRIVFSILYAILFLS